MNIPDIDFTRIRSVGPSGQRGGFEQFICEQVAQESPEPDAKFVSLHGDGGDGGVECYWTLNNGDEYGYQAKYWTHHGDVDKDQLDKSVKAAVEQHPNLKKYKIAIPADPTGPTGGRGKSLLEKIHNAGGWLEGWQKMATDRGMDVEFEIEWETNIVDRLNRLDTSGAQRRYWFDVDVLSDQWWEDRKREAVDTARPRYMPELSVEVPAARSIAALCSDSEWWQIVLDQADQITKAAAQLRYADDEVLAADLDAAREAATKVTDAITAWNTSRTAAGLDDVEQALKVASAIIAAQETAEVQAMDDKHGSWDSEGWRQFQREYQTRFPAAAVDFLRELADKLTEVTESLISPEGKLAGAQVALMTGPAGVGKTYLAIDAVVRRLAMGRPSVMMHGRWFNDHEPLAHLRDVLQMPPDLTSDETIALLDESARAAGAPTLLVIDALNDTRPRSLWRDNLDRLITIIGRYPRVRLLLTARTHYVDHVIPPGLAITRFEHTGFEGVEFEAVSEYATFYGLEPPTSPPIHGEFDNPLYLRLVCEALQANSRLSLDQANMGLDELTKMVLDNANRLISDRIDASPPDNVVHRAMHALAAAIADAGGNPLTRLDAQAVLTQIWADVSAEKSLLDALIAQGLVEEDSIPDGTNPFGTDIVAITFERIGHHLIVSDALIGVTDADGVRAQLAGRLGQLLGLSGTIDVGILEATSVVLAERLGLEVTDFTARDRRRRRHRCRSHRRRRLARHIVHYRDDRRHRRRRPPATRHIRRGSHHAVPARRPPQPPAQRRLPPRIPQQAQHGGPRPVPPRMALPHPRHQRRRRPPHTVGTREAPRPGQRRNHSAVGHRTALDHGATDRRVREPATIASARLLARHPDQAAGLLERFTVVNDEWVLERALDVAYSALLANGTTDDWKAAAEVAWANFFAAPADLTPNVAVRDAARCILEAAADRGALPAGVDCHPVPAPVRQPLAARLAHRSRHRTVRQHGLPEARVLHHRRRLLPVQDRVRPQGPARCRRSRRSQVGRHRSHPPRLPTRLARVVRRTRRRQVRRRSRETRLD